MDLIPGQRTHGFLVERTETVTELDAACTIMRHERTGARLLAIANDDEEKAFAVGFKTPPKDETGVFHILEHSVLCGSDRFPVKEPFVNLLKSSMQTFLNAMTYPDKTVYPVASTNEQDLFNLMDVYLDAVLHPQIYRKRAIFEQEGWHYELDSADGQLAYNGVVFNEMKGVMSDPDSVLFDAVARGLFPNTPYGLESGGHPRAIPTLTYEGYLDEHARHYRLDNAYLVLYGNLDLDRVLGFLDERYLACEPLPSADLGAPNPLGLQAPVRDFGLREEMATAPENACAALGYVIGTAADYERVNAVDVLMDAIAGSNESPLKKALLDAGLAGEAFAFIDAARLQPVMLIELKGSKPNVLDEFRTVVEQTCARLADEGIDRALLEASIAHSEFLLREADYGTSKGVVYALNALNGWLYDDADATKYLRYEETFATLRRKLDEGYFERLLREIVLENPHCCSAEIVPVEAPEQTEEAAELAAVQAKLSPAELQRIVDECAELHRIQEAPDAPEDLAKLPLLTLADIAPSKDETPAWLDEGTPLPCLRHDIRTHGIDYLTFYFDLAGLTFEDMPYASILASVLGKLDTDHHTAAEIDTLVQSTLGRLRFTVGSYQEFGGEDLAAKLMVDASSLSENLERAVELTVEVWSESHLDDTDRIQAILQQRKIALEQHFATAGHAAALTRVSAHTRRAGLLADMLGGVEFYRFLRELLEHFDERKDDLVARLRAVAARAFTQDAVVAFTGAEEDLPRLWTAGGDFRLSEKPASVLAIPEPQPRNEAFIVPSDVCYVGAGGVRLPEDGRHSGTWSVANRLLSFDYLWNEVRVKGGAYGTGFKSARQDTLQFYSYRDPNLDATLARYDRAASWLAAFDPSEEEMRGYVISTVAGIDAPETPRAQARRQDTAYFAKLPAHWRAQLRDEALAATPERLREAAATLERLNERRTVCVFGSRAIIESAQTDLDVTELY